MENRGTAARPPVVLLNLSLVLLALVEAGEHPEIVCHSGMDVLRAVARGSALPPQSRDPGSGYERAKTKPNKAKWVKCRNMSGMDERFRKQSQTTYIPRFHRIAAEKGPFFEKNEWHRSMIQGLAQNKAKQNQTT
jgi:hypothetical protein